jgi:phenylpropionate dioxygenase-like ring-hydroxylating dioxygenase large terminal subunit
LDRCPHRGYPLSEGRVRNNKLICPYHGWEFDDEGRVADIPGDSDFEYSSSCLLQGLNIIEKDGLIWGSESEISDDRIFSPSVHHSHDVASIVRTINADKIDIAENFLDALHTHTVHTGIIRSSKPKHKCSVLVTNTDGGYQAEYTEEKKQTGLLSNLFGGNITKSIGRIRYPGIIEIEYLSDIGIEMSVVIYLIEEAQSSCKLIMRTYLRSCVKNLAMS